MARVDGCHGGDPADDVITGCDESAGVHHVAQELMEAVDPYLVEPPAQP